MIAVIAGSEVNSIAREHCPISVAACELTVCRKCMFIPRVGADEVAL
jgi:hypothetical protein